MTVDFPVDVKISVPSGDYVKLLKFSEDHHTTVSRVLTDLVARCLAPKGKPRKKRVEVTPELLDQIVQLALNRMPQSAIAEKLNLAPATVHNRLKQLGILNPTNSESGAS